MDIKCTRGAPPGVDPFDPRDTTTATSSPLKGACFGLMLSGIENRGGSIEPVGTSFEKSAMRAVLLRVSQTSDLSEKGGAEAAVLDSARHLIRLQLGERFSDTGQGEQLIEELSRFVANDPPLKAKLLNILKSMQAE
ncbi:MAG: hypothetical protein WKF84_04140 [Pyrinomonadaceae bacterium]